MFWVGASVCLLLIAVTGLLYTSWLRARVEALIRSSPGETETSRGHRFRLSGPARLLHPLRQRMQSLEGRVHQLQEQNRERTNFVSQVSHELRTPLTSIRSFTEILLAHPDEADQREEFLCIIREESERLTRILDDLLDLAKIESHRAAFEMQEVPARELVRSAAASVQALARQRSMAIEIECEEEAPPLLGDRDKLMQVLVNLLSNALKFSDEGTAIQVAVALAEDGELRISVRDRGAGIAPADRERIFERFQQVRRPGVRRGTGLGLPICREIVHRHGGRIWVESELGEGSCFSFTIPAASAREAVPPRRQPQEQACSAGA